MASNSAPHMEMVSKRFAQRAGATGLVGRTLNTTSVGANLAEEVADTAVRARSVHSQSWVLKRERAPIFNANNNGQYGVVVQTETPAPDTTTPTPAPAQPRQSDIQGASSLADLKNASAQASAVTDPTL